MIKNTLSTIIAIIIILAAIYGIYYIVTSAPQMEKTDQELIAQILADKYNKNVEDVEIEISQQKDNLALGGIKFKSDQGEQGGGMWLGVKEEGTWKIVFDGNGGIPCSALDGYNFPPAMVNECGDAEGNLKVTDWFYKIENDLTAATDLEFTKTENTEIEWRVVVDNKAEIKKLNGFQLTVADLTEEQYQTLETYFKNFGFTEDIENAAAGPFANLSGYKKDDLVCTLYYEVSDENVAHETYLRSTTIKCAFLENEQTVGLANPASVYCEEQGGTLEMREAEAGTAGYCIFEDGSECEEWAYFREECLPGNSLK